MSVKVNPPVSAAVVEIPDELVEKYEAQGWTVVKEPVKPRRSEK